MSAAAPAPTTKAAKAADKMALVDDNDASASESDDTEIGLEEEAPVDGAAEDDSTTSMGEGDDDEEEDEEDSEKQAGAVGIDAAATTTTASTSGVPDFKTARARKSKTSPAKIKGGAACDEEPELVSGKRRAAAMAHEIIHATSAAGQAEARVASAQARAIAEKKKARKRAASTATKEAANGQPPAKKARTSSSSSSSAGSKKSTTTTKAKKSGASGSTKAATKAKTAKSSTKAGATTTKKAAKTSAAKGATTKTAKKPAGKGASSSSSSGSASKTAKKTKASAAPAPKKLPLKDAHTKYRARLAVMPKADFAVLDGAWLSVFDPHLRKRASFPEGHFSPKWTQVLAEVAREKGAIVKGVLPHYATTIEGTDNLKAYEKMPQIVDKERAGAYAAAGFDQVTPARVYVGPAVLAAGVGESPFAFVHADTIDDAFWQSVKKVLDADSSNDDPVDVVAHGSEMEDVEVAA